MRIAIASSGNKKSSLIDSRFGRCAFFQIVDLENPENIEVVSNPGRNTQRGAGVVAAQLIADQGAEKVIAGNFGPNAFQALQSAGIQAITKNLKVSVDQIIKGFKSEKS
jgi:predicted Fe-Mo cluster-binding NifX family protein